jgi:hypothetical protein
MHSTINLERLFQLRLVIARLGERDNAGWWNTQGLLQQYLPARFINNSFSLAMGWIYQHCTAPLR